MFERFTEQSRRVVVLAQDEARRLNHHYIGTEHLLLGLLREEDGLAARVLESLGVTLDRIREQVARLVGAGEEVTSGQIPFTPRAKKVLGSGGGGRSTPAGSTDSRRSWTAWGRRSEVSCAATRTLGISCSY